MARLGRRGDRSPFPPHDVEIGIDAAVLALSALFDREAAAGVRATYELRLGDDRFRVGIADGEITLARGSAEQPDAIIETAPHTLAMLVSHQCALAEALSSGEVAIEGGVPAIARLLDLFAPPEPAAAPVPAETDV